MIVMPEKEVNFSDFLEFQINFNVNDILHVDNINT